MLEEGQEESMMTHGDGRKTARAPDFDAVIVGASLSGCAAAIALAGRGARVALVERRPDPDAFKRVCGHFIQAGAVPTLDRLGLLDAIEGAGGVRSHVRLWTRWGFVETAPDAPLTRSVNLRRERLDPLVRAVAAEQDGVELILGRTAKRLLTDGGRLTGVEVAARGGERSNLRARLVVAADGRDSRVAEMAEVRGRTSPHGRFSYAAYYEGPPPDGAPDATLWMLDPHWAAAFPTDAGLTMYACMPTMNRLADFKRDPAASLEAFMSELPARPPITDSRRVSPAIGKVKMPNVRREATAPGLALVGDALLATDPLWGVGCGWAFQSAEWLADSVAAALRGEEPLERGLRRYRRRQARELAGHAFLIHDYATGRRFSPVERLLYSAAARDRRTAEGLATFGTRSVGPGRLLAPAARAIAVNIRHRLTRGAVGAPGAAGLGPAA
jgi:menaquinone-9 beta-reductase